MSIDSEKHYSNYIENYFNLIEKSVNKSYGLAKECRKMGLDPETKVDIPLANDVAERVEALIGAEDSNIVGKGLPERIREFEKKYGAGDWRVALKIAESVAKQEFCSFKSEEKALEMGVRTGLAYLTLGIVSAPLEGFVELKLKDRMDGKGKYISCYFAGPIRAAGGTAQSVSVLIADYLGIKFGYQSYDPTPEEIERYISEIDSYHRMISRLQYYPSDEELVFLLKHLRIEINGDPTSKREVLIHKDLPRVGTPLIRGGMCLVLAEGLSQKGKKIVKQIHKWGKEFGLENWLFLDEFLALQKKLHSTTEKTDVEKTVVSNSRFIEDIVAGRPIFSYPLKQGGFRLRYGRSRLTGLAAAGINPITLYILDSFIATGSQLKVERPGKACAVTPCDSIRGPLVRLDNGDFIEIKTQEEAIKLKDRVKKIVFLGDILFNYGDFSENGSMLVPSAYVPEWWVLDVKEKDINKDYIFLTDNPFQHITFSKALEISNNLKVPLHPDFVFFWNRIEKDDLKFLVNFIKNNSIFDNEELRIKKDAKIKDLLEKLGVIHKEKIDFYLIEKDICKAFLYQIKNNGFIKNFEGTTALEIINNNTPIEIKDVCGTPIGTRLGRPEKAKLRKLKGSPQCLFPCGEEGGRLRNLTTSYENGFVESNFALRYCEKCNKQTIYTSCELCGNPTIEQKYCVKCKKITNESVHCGEETIFYSNRKIDIKHYMNCALKNLGVELPVLFKGVRGMTSKKKIPEHLEKGILRAIHGVYVNKDGTIRYDIIETPITHFKPSEINVSVEKLKELGYEKDINGNALIDENQIIELFPQDLILPDCDYEGSSAKKELFKVCNFVDDLLVKFYKKKPFYNLKSPDDLVGHLVIGLAPHTSAGIVGRIIGFSKTQGFYAHPSYHAAMRRNCDGDESCVMMLMDALLNFSRQFLPDRRGGRAMDAPLVLTSKLIPNEVDSEVHGMDIVSFYPKEFYEATLDLKYPWEVNIKQLGDVLNTPEQYEGIKYTHPVSNINLGPVISSYKTIESMIDKVLKQMKLQEKICAVDEADAGGRLINKHFMKDIKGNLRKFSLQQFRCVNCNTKYRRIPLSGKCPICKGRIIQTVTEGGVVKYIEPALTISKKYKLPNYLRQTIKLVKNNVESTFGEEKEQQTDLNTWFKTL